jgi:hypothetical protein
VGSGIQFNLNEVKTDDIGLLIVAMDEIIARAVKLTEPYKYDKFKTLFYDRRIIDLL